MPKQVMRHKASDNEYLHKDFHGALSCGIEYLHVCYGEDAVRAYLCDFAASFFAPLREALISRGLVALKAHFEKVYKVEQAEAEFSLSGNELVIRVKACPAVTHMRRQGYQVARLFHETTRTVNEALCEGTPYAAELVEYDYGTGRSVQRFFRRTEGPTSCP